MEKLDPKSKWIFFFQSLLVVFAYSLALAYVIWSFLILSHPFSPRNLIHWGISIIIWGAISLIIYIIFCYIWAELTYKSWKYEFTDTAFRIERGVIWKRYVSIPYGRIQNVDIYRGILTRILGLSTLKIQTAGLGGNYTNRFGGAEGKLPGLSKEKAEELRDALIKKSQEYKQGL